MTTPAEKARAFASVADAYDRARPGYPREAAAWLAEGLPPRARVLELGAGTGLLTTELLGLDLAVVATDPLTAMLGHLTRRLPGARAVQAAAERIPLASRSVDLVVSAQAFHWFDHDRAIPEIARVLRPGGRLALAWNVRDDRIPWVRRLGEVLGDAEQRTDYAHELIRSNLFGFVEHATFRVWQPLDRGRLRDLALSRSDVAVLEQADRDEVLARVDGLYDEYARGAEGLLLPYLTRCYRSVVRPRAEHEPPAGGPQPPADPPTEDDDPGALLIDFR